MIICVSVNPALHSHCCERYGDCTTAVTLELPLAHLPVLQAYSWSCASGWACRL